MIKRLFAFIASMFSMFVQLAPTGETTHQELNYSELLLPKYRKIFYETYDEVPEQYSKIFNLKKSNKAQEFEFGMGAMGAWDKFGSTTSAVSGSNEMPTIPYVVVPKGLERVYTHEEFAQGFMIERKFMDDEQYSVLEKMTKDLARAGRYKVESDAAQFFMNGFNAATPIYNENPLFAGNHPLVGGGEASNLIEGALSDTTLKAATTLMRKTVDEAGKLVQFLPDTLVVPPEQEWLAMELIKSAQKPGTNHNDINALMGRFKIVVWDFITDPDMWFLMDSKRHEASFFWRVKPEFNKEKDFDTIISKWSGYMRYSLGASDWRGIVGSHGNGTGGLTLKNVAFKCAAGSSSGNTKVATVLPIAGTGESYMVKLNGARPALNEVLTNKGWTAYTLGDNIAAPKGSDVAIAIVETSSGKAKGYGSGKAVLPA